MRRECLSVPNVATIPPELKKIPRIRKIDKWYAKPRLESGKEGLEEVDAYKILEPLLKEKSLVETLRMADLLNGCFNQCDTCEADASIPNKIFSFSSLTKLFEDDNFMEMLQPNYLRFGCHGDILHHPQALDIVEMVLEKTKKLYKKSIYADQRWHMRGYERNPALVLYFNYRPQFEKEIDKLVDLASKNERNERLAICVSLPLNKDDIYNREFIDYAKLRKDYFKVMDRREYNYPDIKGKFKNIFVHNVADRYNGTPLSLAGRKLDDKIMYSLMPREYCRGTRGVLHYISRGLSYTYFNPDGLWLMVYATGIESYTCGIYTPINNENINILNQIPCHYDSIKPPNWPGGIADVRRGAEKSDFQKFLFRRNMDLIFGGKTRQPSVVKYE